MADIILKTDCPKKARKILSETLETEISRLEYCLSMGKKRLLKFEKKYKITSDVFINDWTAEDLDGKDMEYIEWTGEHKLFINLYDRLITLKSLIHVS